MKAGPKSKKRGPKVRVATARAANTDERGIQRFREQLQKLVPATFAVDEELRQLMAEEEGEPIRQDSEPVVSAFGKPCSESDIKKLEKLYGRGLPPSYVAYLSLYGKGKKRFGSPLGPDDHGEAVGALESLSDLFDEFGDDNPITDDVIPFYIHTDSRDCVLFVPSKGGGTDVVTYDRTKEQQRFPDLVRYYRAQLATATSCIADYAKRKKDRSKGAIHTVRQALDAVLAGKALREKAFKEVTERLQGHLPAGNLPSEAVIEELASGDESERFLAALRAIKNVPDSVLMSLAYGAVELLRPEMQRSPSSAKKALPVVELLFDVARRKPKRPAGHRYERFLGLVNTAIMQTFMRKEFPLAARLADLAAPYAHDDVYLPHNAACAFAATKRYDDALAMCRIAVANKYPLINRLKTDKDLGALLRRADFKALFA